MVEAFEGNEAETKTKTMLPVIEAFKSAHDVAEVTVVADAGMISDANGEGIEDAGLLFIIGERIPEVPYVIRQWRRENPDAVPEDGQVFTAPWPATGKKKAAGRRDKVTYYQYRADRARRTIRGIDQQIAKAENAVAGKAAVKRNRFVKLTRGAWTVNRDLESKARAPGVQGPHHQHRQPRARVRDRCLPQLWRIEKTFRISRHGLRARPIHHHKRESIEAHLIIVFATLAVTRFVENATGSSIKRFVRTARRYRTVQIRVGAHTQTAEDPLPPDLRDVLARIN